MDIQNLRQMLDNASIDYEYEEAFYGREGNYEVIHVREWGTNILARYCFHHSNPDYSSPETAGQLSGLDMFAEGPIWKPE